MAERFFKFLRRGAIGPFSGMRWEPGPWVRVDGPLEPCVRGVHVCRAADLPYWLDDELWEVEVAGDRIDGAAKVVVERARLGAPIEGWPRPAGIEFARDCLALVHRLATRELELANDRAADPLAAARDPTEAARLARELADEDLPARRESAMRLLRLLADAADYAPTDENDGAAAGARSVAYIAAYAADRATVDRSERPPPGMSAFERECARQSLRLAGALGLDRA
jgi:hypothetical protein